MEPSSSNRLDLVHELHRLRHCHLRLTRVERFQSSQRWNIFLYAAMSRCRRMTARCVAASAQVVGTSTCKATRLSVSLFHCVFCYYRDLNLGQCKNFLRGNLKKTPHHKWSSQPRHTATAFFRTSVVQALARSEACFQSLVSYL